MDDSRHLRLRPDQWLDEHGDALYRYALARTGRTEVAQDLVQETLLAAWQGRDRFQGTASERSWLLGICRHKALDHLRRVGRDVMRDNAAGAVEGAEATYFTDKGAWRQPPSAWSTDPLDEAEAQAFLQALQQCLSALPEAQRDGFSLHSLEGLEPAQVSTTLDISVSHFYVLLHRARLGLRRCLQRRWFGREDAS